MSSRCFRKASPALIVPLVLGSFALVGSTAGCGKSGGDEAKTPTTSEMPQEAKEHMVNRGMNPGSGAPAGGGGGQQTAPPGPR